jgi:hypothetical protein
LPFLTPGDRFLFGHVKYSLQGIVFALHKEFIATTHERPTDVLKEALRLGLDHWLERFEWFP